MTLVQLQTLINHLGPVADAANRFVAWSDPTGETAYPQRPSQRGLAGELVHRVRQAQLAGSLPQAQQTYLQAAQGAGLPDETWTAAVPSVGTTLDALAAALAASDTATAATVLATLRATLGE